MTDNPTKVNIPWNPQDVDFIFHSYQIFERKFVDILRVLPLTKENEQSWSPELVNLFLDISSLVDSVSRNIIGLGKNNNDTVQIKGLTDISISRKVGKLNIDDFETNLFSDLKLFESRVVVYVYPLQVIKPYKDYRNIDMDGWWSIYNLLKHNRIKNYNKANLINVLNALAGLFLLLVRYKEEEFSKALFRLGWLEIGIMPEFVHQERVREAWNFWYDTELFGTHELSENVPEDIATINPVLTSQKFRKFFGRFNP